MRQKCGPTGWLESQLEPRLRLVAAPCVDADFAARSTRAAPDEQRAAAVIEIRFGTHERFLDASPCSPEDQAAEPAAVGAVTGGAHDAMISSTLGGSAG